MSLVSVDRSLTTEEFAERFIRLYLRDTGPQTTEQITRAVNWAQRAFIQTYCLEALECGEMAIVGWDGDEPRFALTTGVLRW